MYYLKKAIKVMGIAFGSFENKTRLLAVGVSSLVNVSSNVIAPYLFVKALSQLIEGDDVEEKDKSKVYIFTTAYGLLWLTSRLAQAMRMKLLSRPSVDLAHSLTIGIIEEYYNRPMEFRADRSAAAEIQHFSHVYEHIAKNFITASLSRALPTMLEVITVTILVSYEGDYSIGLLLFAIATSYSFLTAYSSKRVGSAKNIWNEKAFNAFESVTQRLEQYESANYSNNIKFELLKLNSSLDEFDKAHVRFESVSEGMNAIQSIFISVGFTGVLVLAAKLAVSNRLSTDHLIWIVLYMSQFSLGLEELTKAFNQINQSFINFKLLVDYFDEDHDFKYDKQNPDLRICTGEATIVFDNVSLRYSGREEYALKNVSFEARPGEVIALIGESGSGKSSILHLLLGFYRPTCGSIILNNQNINFVNRYSLRSAYAVIPQKPFLYNDTIAKNVAYGCPELSQNTHVIDEVISAACLNKLVRVLGLHKHIGQSGKKISGGQQQRVSIARAMLKLRGGAAIVLADEPTSALDERTANVIVNQIYRLCREAGVTAFVVTHNLRHLNINNIDKVIMLERGSLVEVGTIPELLGKQGLFAQQAELAGISNDYLLSEQKELENDIPMLNPEYEEDSSDEDLLLDCAASSSDDPLVPLLEGNIQITT